MTKAFDISKFRKSITKSVDGLSIGFRDPTDWISTGSYALNYMISSDFYKGVPLGKVTVFAGQSGCLPGTAIVRIKQDDRTSSITVAKLKEIFHSDTKFTISTPDGWHEVTAWFDKGMLDMYTITTDNGFTTKCAYNHLIEVVTPSGERSWLPAIDVKQGTAIITEKGESKATFDAIASAPEECFDFTVDHDNHRYWGDGISSHNSGKSYICSGNIVKHAQEQGIYVVLIDSENALDESWLHALGVDTSEDKLLKLNMAMIDDVAKTITEFMKEFRGMIDAERPKVLFVIDSLGMLLTPTDVNQFNAGDLKGDMGRKPKALAALVRNCVNMFGEHNVGLVATNHSYASQDMFNPDDVVSGGCLTAGHQLWMADGSAKNIEDIQIGDTVLTLNGDIDVAKTFFYDDKEVFELTLEDGEVIKATGEHKFLVITDDNEKIWKSVNELSPGDEILKLV